MNPKSSEERTDQCLFEHYEQCRIDVANKLVELSARPSMTKWIQKYNGTDWVMAMLRDKPLIRRHGFTIVRNLCGNSPEMCREICERKVIDMIIDNPEKDEMNMKIMILSILKNIVKHDECLAIHIVKEYQLLKLIEYSLKENAPKLKQEALDCLLQLTKHGKFICDLVINSCPIMGHLFCFCCNDTKHEAILLKSLQIIKKICTHSHSDSPHYSSNLIRCLLAVLKRTYCNLKPPILAIEALNIWNDQGIHSKQLVDENIVDIMKKYISDYTTANKPAFLLCQKLSETSNDACGRMIQNGFVESFLYFVLINKDFVNIHALHTIGNIADKSHTNALVLAEDKGAIKAINSLLSEVKDPSDELLMSCIHALQEMCKYSSRHLESFISENMFSYFNHLHRMNRIQTQIEHMFEQLIPCCNDALILEKLFFYHLPVDSKGNKLFGVILQSFCKILPYNCEAKKTFVLHGLLKVIANCNELLENPTTVSISTPSYLGNTDYKPFIQIILSCFPTELIRYYDEHFKEYILRDEDSALLYSGYGDEDVSLVLSADVSGHFASA